MLQRIDPNQHDVFLLRQKLTLGKNKYVFSLPDAAGNETEPFLYVEQKPFKIKEDIRFYTDESKSEQVLGIKARTHFDPSARYEITGPAGETIGEIKKDFGRSLLSSTFLLFDAEGEQVAEATESNFALALARRFLGGSGAQFLPYHFVFSRGGQTLATNVRRGFSIADVYTIDCSADSGRTLDRRLVLAAAVGMDALMER